MESITENKQKGFFGVSSVVFVVGLVSLLTDLSSEIAGFLWQAYGPLMTFGASSVLAVLAAVLMVVFRI